MLLIHDLVTSMIFFPICKKFDMDDVFIKDKITPIHLNLSLSLYSENGQYDMIINA